ERGSFARPLTTTVTASRRATRTASPSSKACPAMFDPAPFVGLAKRLAPELEGVPVYILSIDQVAGIPVPSDASGWVLGGDTMQAAYVDRIVDYRGPGPVIVVDDNYARMAAKPGKLQALLQATLIHELGHILP